MLLRHKSDIVIDSGNNKFEDSCSRYAVYRIGNRALNYYDIHKYVCWKFEQFMQKLVFTLSN